MASLPITPSSIALLQDFPGNSPYLEDCWRSAVGDHGAGRAIEAFTLATDPGKMAPMSTMNPTSEHAMSRPSRSRNPQHDPDGAAASSLAVRLGLAAVAAAVLLAGVLAAFPHAINCDIWWHLKAGEVIVEQGRIPTTDPFTYTAEGRRWVTHEWLAEVVFHGVDRLGGLDALIVMKAVLAMAALALAAAAGLTGPGWRDRLGPVALGVLLAAPLLTARAFARPHMMTAVLLAAVLLLLCRERDRGGRRTWLLLLPVFWVWANVHAGFVLGILLVALFWLGSWWEQRRAVPGVPWRRVGMLAALVAVTLLNPNHIHALLYPLHLVARPDISDGIQELRNVFHPYYRGALFQQALLLVALVTAVLLGGNRDRRVWAVLLPGAVFALLAMRNIRGVSEFAVLVPVLIGLHGGWLGRGRRTAVAVPALVLVVAVLAVPAVGRWGVPMGPDHQRRPGLGVSDEAPLAGVASFLEAIGPQGRAFNLLGHGGYLIHRLWPERTVFIDGRLDIYPPGFIGEYGDLLRTGEGWDELVERWGIDLAVVDRRQGPGGDYGLRRRLRHDDEWVCVFFTSDAVVYARRDAGLAAVIERFGSPYDPTAPAATDTIAAFVAGAAPADVARAVAAMAAWVPLQPDDALLSPILGQMLAASGRDSEASRWFRRAIIQDREATDGKRTVDLQLLLARSLIKADSTRAARTELDALIRAAPTRVEPLLLLAALHQQSGDLEAARATIERARALQPRHPSVLRTLEILEQLERRR